jgi:hypothetical protein
MFKVSSFAASVLLVLLTSVAFAEGPWIMEWWSLSPVTSTGGIGPGISTDWIEQIFGVPEGELSILGKVPGHLAKGDYVISPLKTTTLPMTDPVLVGLAVTSHSDGVITTAVASDMTFNGAEVDFADLTSEDIGTDGGSVDYSNGVCTVKADGADIWGTADGFRFTYAEVSGDFEVVLKAESIEHTNDWAKIGPMVRQNNSAGSPYVFMLARALEGNRYFQERMEQDGSATDTGGSVTDPVGFPVWLKITRKGDDFTADVSTDGNTWIQPEVKEMGWHVGNLGDINNSTNLSNGIYEGQWGDMSNYVYYGIVVVNSPVDQDTVVHIGQDDDLKLWMNGEFIAEWNGWTGGVLNTNPYNVHLNKGDNVMLVKVSEGGGGDYLNARFDAENLTFNPSNGVFDTVGTVSPAGKLSVPWGSIKVFR